MNYDFITDRLAVGDVASRCDSGFDAVVSVITTTERPGILCAELLPGRGPQVPEGTPVHEIDLADGECFAMGPYMRGLESYLDGAVEFIAAHIKTGYVLVHCGAGHSRSVAVVCAYLCRYAGMSWSEALALVKSRRPAASPCDAFYRAVTNWLRLDTLTASGPHCAAPPKGSTP